MSFSIGGDGPFLPPRKQKPQGLGAAKDRATPKPVVQESAPAFTEPGVQVAAGDQTVKLPIDTPRNVVDIGSRRKFKNLSEAAQTAIAKSAGTVVPVANIRDDRAPFQPSQQPPADATQATLPPPSGNVDADKLCKAVFILQAARYGHTLDVDGKLFSVEQVRSAAEKVAPALQRALKEGRVSPEQVQACADAYCRQFSCAAPSQTMPPDQVSPPAPPAPAAREETAAPVVVAPAPTPAPSSGGGIVRFVAPAAPRDEEVAVSVQKLEKKSSSSLWWLVALIGAGILVKKLSAVKVIGAAVAGVPLIAELESDADEEDDTASHEDADHEPEEASHEGED